MTFNQTQLVGYNNPSTDGGAYETGWDDDSYNAGISDREIWGIYETPETQRKERQWWSLPSNYTRMDMSIISQYDASRPEILPDNLKSWAGPTTQNTDIGQYWNNGDSSFLEDGLWNPYVPGVLSTQAFNEPND